MIKIFYVEDEPFLAKIVVETLELKSYQVTHVSDGAQALHTFKNDAFDICIFDIMLPNKNGYKIAEEVRAVTPEIPIIFLTAKNQTQDVLKGFQSGGNDYIKKPFSMEELMVRIENLLALSHKKSKEIPDQFRIGEAYIFYPQKMELHNQNITKKLSHKEAQILELLCKNKNDITQRKDILLKVWNDDSFYNSRNLDVYITKLRSHFINNPGIKIITLKGVGYHFSDQ